VTDDEAKIRMMCVVPPVTATVISELAKALNCSGSEIVHIAVHHLAHDTGVSLKLPRSYVGPLLVSGRLLSPDAMEVELQACWEDIASLDEENRRLKAELQAERDLR